MKTNLYLSPAPNTAIGLVDKMKHVSHHLAIVLVLFSAFATAGGLFQPNLATIENSKGLAEVPHDAFRGERHSSKENRLNVQGYPKVSDIMFVPARLARLLW